MSIRTVILGGIIASLLIAMWEMVVEALIPGGAGLFGPPIAIGATIVRDLQGSSNPIPFDLPALVLGLAGHMMNSVILTGVFGFLVRGRGLSASRLVRAGVLWGAVIFAAMWFAIVPAVDPLMLNLDAAAFLAGHLMWGAGLGVLWSRVAVGDRSYSLRPA